MKTDLNTYFIEKDELRALLAFASKDTTRPHLCCVALVRGQACATDGHTAVVLTQPESPTWPKLDFVIPRKTAEMVMKVLGPETTLAAERVGDDVRLWVTDAARELRTNETTFKAPDVQPPPYAQVIPAAPSELSCSPTSLNADYLARLALVQKAAFAHGVEIYPGPGQDPTIFEVKGKTGDWKGAIMPMRSELTERVAAERFAPRAVREPVSERALQVA